MGNLWASIVLAVFSLYWYKINDLLYDSFFSYYRECHLFSEFFTS